MEVTLAHSRPLPFTLAHPLLPPTLSHHAARPGALVRQPGHVSPLLPQPHPTTILQEGPQSKPELLWPPRRRPLRDPRVQPGVRAAELGSATCPDPQRDP